MTTRILCHLAHDAMALNLADSCMYLIGPASLWWGLSFFYCRETAGTYYDYLPQAAAGRLGH